MASRQQIQRRGSSSGLIMSHDTIRINVSGTKYPVGKHLVAGKPYQFIISYNMLLSFYLVSSVAKELGLATVNEDTNEW